MRVVRRKHQRFMLEVEAFAELPHHLPADLVDHKDRVQVAPAHEDVAGSETYVAGGKGWIVPQFVDRIDVSGVVR